MINPPAFRRASSAQPARMAAAFLLLGTTMAAPAAAGGLVNPFTALPWAPFGLQFNGQFGFSAAPAGDVNGDGYDDLLVGTQSFTVGGFAAAGVAFVYHGGPSGLAAAPAQTWTGAAENGYFGSVLSAAGDVNGDGFADGLIGSPGLSTRVGGCRLVQSRPGACHVR